MGYNRIMTERKNDNFAQREKQGRNASIVGIVLNFLLAASKIVAGFFAGLISLVADGLNNLSDCGSSTVSLVSFRIAAKPADKEHPYGHRRFEYVATMVIAFFVLFFAIELLRESFDRILAGQTSAGGWFIYLIMGVSFLVKGGMYFYYRGVAKKISSDALKAAATDSACDCLATFVVFVGALISQFTVFSADGYAGLLVALFIGWQGINILREASSKLIGQAPEPAVIAGIKARVLAYEGVLGLHDLHVYSYGPGKYFASVHIEVDANVPVLEAHELVDYIEREFAEQTDVLLTGHLDPIVTDDERTNALRARVEEAVKRESIEWNIHDFRVVWGEKISKVLFDLTVPFDCKQTNEELNVLFAEKMRTMGAFEPIITVERE